MKKMKPSSVFQNILQRHTNFHPDGQAAGLAILNISDEIDHNI